MYIQTYNYNVESSETTASLNSKETRTAALITLKIDQYRALSNVHFIIEKPVQFRNLEDAVVVGVSLNATSFQDPMLFVQDQIAKDLFVYATITSEQKILVRFEAESAAGAQISGTPVIKLLVLGDA